jgi:hypothetical protein
MCEVDIEFTITDFYAFRYIDIIFYTIGFQPDHFKQYIEWYAQKYQITDPNQWYSITVEDILATGAEILVTEHYFADVLAQASKYVGWIPWKFQDPRIVPPEVWDDIDNVRQAMELMKEDLGVYNPEDWYKVINTYNFANVLILSLYINIKVTESDFVRRGKQHLLKLADYDMGKTIHMVFKELEWDLLAQAVTVSENFPSFLLPNDSIEHCSQFF